MPPWTPSTAWPAIALTREPKRSSWPSSPCTPCTTQDRCASVSTERRGSCLALGRGLDLAAQPVSHARGNFDAFGLHRCLWGTDWTRAVKVLTYQEGVEAFRVTDRLSDSDRAALMGGTLERVYKWSPSQA